MTTIDELKSEIVKRDETLSNELINSEKRNSELRLEVSDLTERMFDKDKRIQELTTAFNNENLKNKDFEELVELEKLKNSTTLEDLNMELRKRDEKFSRQLRNYETQTGELNSKIQELNETIFNRDKHIEELTLVLSNKKSKTNFAENIIRFANNFELLERIEGNRIIYIDNETKRMVSEKEVVDLMTKFPYNRHAFK